MFFFGRESLVYMTLVMAGAGLIGNLAGFATTWSTVKAPEIATTPTA
jgi:hypothetical protein